MTRAALTLEVIDDASRLLDLQREWSAFTRTIEGLTPFQLPEWLITWWRHFGSGNLRCFLFRSADEIAGFVPCFLHEWNGARQITLIGAGISDYLEPVLKPEYAAEMVARIGSYLASASDWDICHWQDLSFNSPWKELASEAAEDTECMAIPIEGGFTEYWEGCAGSLRQNVRRDMAKAEARGKVQFHVTKQAEPELLDALIEMHGARWQKRDQPGMIEANRSAAFLRDIAREFAAREMLRIFSLRFRGEIAAVIFAFDYRKRISNYLTAFDPDNKHLGLGRTLLYEAIRYSFENGYKVWDFLRGDEPYKRWWGAQKIPKARLIIVNRKA